MNILKETHSRLEYQYAKLKDLQECLEQGISKDCAKHIRDLIYSTTKAIEYYQEIVNSLEKVKESEK